MTRLTVLILAAVSLLTLAVAWRMPVPRTVVVPPLYREPSPEEIRCRAMRAYNLTQPPHQKRRAGCP